MKLTYDIIKSKISLWFLISSTNNLNKNFICIKYAIRYTIILSIMYVSVIYTMMF